MTGHEKLIPLVEAFGPTIQGEGNMVGVQTYFLRFGLCDYKCKMCDSWHAVDPRLVKAHAQWLTQLEIYRQLLSIHKPNSTRWVTFSGGNPCIHDLSILVDSLKTGKFKICVETQGTIAPSWLNKVDQIVISPKGPGMGETTNFAQLDAFVNQVATAAPTIFKVVVFDQRDLDFTVHLYDRFKRYFPAKYFYLSLGNMHPPPDGRNWDSVEYTKHIMTLVGAYKVLFEDIQANPILSQMRFLPQLHVFLWGNEKGK